MDDTKIKEDNPVIISCRTCWYEAYADREPCMYCMGNHCWAPKGKVIHENQG